MTKKEKAQPRTAHRDRDICANCGRWREQHYREDGSWDHEANAEAECDEYYGRTPTPEELGTK